jgi:transposase
MHATTCAVDLAKSVFQLAFADADWKPCGTQRLTRARFSHCFQNNTTSLVVMEACGSAHYWARQISALGIEVRLLPPRYVRRYRKRNKTDAADAAALLEAARCADIQPVRIKSVEQQALQSLHRARALWMRERTRQINALRGFCREFGVYITQGVRLGLEQIGRALADPNSALPELLRPTMRAMLDDIRLIEVRVSQLEAQLSELAKQSNACTQLMSIPGVGLITATALVAATSGEVGHFKDARHFASWFGLAPKEYSSGHTRRMGRISKRGDRYLRTLLIHGARAVIMHAQRATQKGHTVDPLRSWALSVRQRKHSNRATCALANKLARICFAVLRDHEPYAIAPRLPYKLARTSFVIAH